MCKEHSLLWFAEIVQLKEWAIRSNIKNKMNLIDF